MKFFSPTSELKELLLLQHIEKNPDTTQKEIARVIDGAPSMVNVYIDNLEKQNYMVRDYQSAKIVYYNITPKGVKRKNLLLITYMRELLDLYHMAKRNMEMFLKGLEAKGYKDLLLYGAGEVAETMIGVIRDKEETSVNIVAIIDDNVGKQGKEMMGYKIISREEIDKFHHDAIVITSYTFEEKIMERLKEVNYPMDSVEKFFGIQVFD